MWLCHRTVNGSVCLHADFNEPQSPRAALPVLASARLGSRVMRPHQRPRTGRRRDDEIRVIRTETVRYPGHEHPLIDEMTDDSAGSGGGGRPFDAIGRPHLDQWPLPHPGPRYGTRSRGPCRAGRARPHPEATADHDHRRGGRARASDRRLGLAVLLGPPRGIPSARRELVLIRGQRAGCRPRAAIQAGRHVPRDPEATQPDTDLRVLRPGQTAPAGPRQQAHGDRLPPGFLRVGASHEDPAQGRQASESNDHRGTSRDTSRQPTGADAVLVGKVLRMWRARPGKPDTAADVGAKPGTNVISPVTGTVVKIKSLQALRQVARLRDAHRA